LGLRLQVANKREIEAGVEDENKSQK